MSNIQTGAERMPHDLSHLGFLAGQIGRLITISTTPVIAGDSFEMDAVGALRLSPLRRGLAIDSTVDIFTFYVPHRHVYGEQWINRKTVLDRHLDHVLMVLIVWHPEFEERIRRRPIGLGGAPDQPDNRGGDMVAIRRDHVDGRARQHPALRPRMARADSFVIRI